MLTDAECAEMNCDCRWDYHETDSCFVPVVERILSTRATELVAAIQGFAAGHVFDYQEWDTGVWKCRHPSHMGVHAASCFHAEVMRSIIPLIEGGAAHE